MQEMSKHEERLKRRQTRRWKRRARILAPIASLPLLLAALLLSVDIIEYRPEEPRTNSATVKAPAKAGVQTAQRRIATRTAISMSSSATSGTFFEQIKREIDADKTKEMKHAGPTPQAYIPAPTVGLPK